MGQGMTGFLRNASGHVAAEYAMLISIIAVAITLAVLQAWPNSKAGLDWTPGGPSAPASER